MNFKSLLLLCVILCLSLNAIANTSFKESKRSSHHQSVSSINPTNNILYVNKNVAGGDGSGSSWVNALPELADALKWAKENETSFESTSLQIWVAKGTYNPKYRADNLDGTNATDRWNSFLLVKNVSLFGGFAGGETDLNARDWKTNPTILSGDFANDDITTGKGKTLSMTGFSENAIHVLMAINDVGTAEVNGFSVKGGFSNSYDQITVNGISLTSSIGGAAFYLSGNSLVVNNCTITENASQNWGAIYAVGSGATFNHCIFSKNAGGQSGVFNLYYVNRFKVVNSLIIGNSAGSEGGIAYIGGGYYNTAPCFSLINSTAVGNYSYNDIGFKISYASIAVTNSIVLHKEFSDKPGIVLEGTESWKTLSNSLIQKETSNNYDNIADGPGITEQQIFQDILNGDYTIKNPSVAYNAGSNNLYNADGRNASTDKDLADNPRLIGPNIDLGAFENTYDLQTPTLSLLTDSGTSNSDGITNINLPTFGGTAASGTTVTVLIDDQNGGQVETDGNGNWSLTLTNALSEGIHSVKVHASLGTSTSALSDNLPITIDTTLPVVTGVVDGLTYNNTRTIGYNEGTATLNGATILTGYSIATNGTYQLVVTDVAGNTTTINFSIQKSTIVPSASRILYVNQNVSGGNGSGDSWTNAVTELADALVYAQQNKTLYSNSQRLQIWVAAGNYKPLFSPADNNFGNNADRDNTFLMVNFVDLYGGFAGIESSHADRNWYINKTVLNGDLLGNDTPSLSGAQYLEDTTRQDNAYHVVTYMNNIVSTSYDVNQRGSLIDGFSIINGNANSFEIDYLVINGMQTDRYMGGAINARTSYPQLNNMIFKANSGYYGGAIVASYSMNGGLLYYYKTHITNTLFEGNHGHYTGSALYASGTLASLTNTTFVKHTCGNGYIGSVVRGSQATLVNSISLNPGIQSLQTSDMTFDPVDYSNVQNSLIQGNTNLDNGNLNATNITVNDIFSNPSLADYTLKSGSIAINSGNNSKYLETGLAGTSKDLAGNSRIMEGTIDLGPYELQAACPPIDAPIANASQTFCGSKYISDLAAIPAANTTLLWYATSTETTSLSNSTVLQNGTTYYASSSSFGCESQQRTAVKVTVGAIPGQPVVTSPIQLQQNATASPLTATTDAGHTLKWYDENNDPISTPTPNTAALGSTEYYVSQVNSLGCEGYTATIIVQVVPTIVTPNTNGIVFVNKNVTGGNNSGNSWSNAVPELASALEFAVNNTAIKEVWVAAATYTPLFYGDGQFQDNNKNNSFPIANLKVYGGFNGSETALNQRDWKVNRTLLSGDIGTVGVNSDNIRNIIYSYSAVNETILDGFIIEKANEGTAFLAVSSVARHIVNHCIFRDNSSDVGAAIYSEDMRNFIIANSLFTNNNAAFVGGALASIGTDASQITNVINSLFIDNSAIHMGGAVISIGNLKIHNSILWGNTLDGVATAIGADIAPDDSDVGSEGPQIFNSLTQVYTGLTLPGARTASGVIVGQDPLFTNPSASDFSLQQNSPAKDAGDNGAYDATILGSKDLAGSDRLRNTTLDIGAFEIQQGNNPLPVKLVSFDGTQEHGLVSLLWKTAEELNTSHFEIERSMDGKQFVHAGKVQANLIGNHSYAFIDTKYALLSNSYYRLKMMDLDGSFAYSRIISIDTDAKGRNKTLTAYPNPTASGKTITLETSTAGKANLIDIKGMSRGQFNLKTGANTVTLPQLTPGIYFISMGDGQVSKLVIRE